MAIWAALAPALISAGAQLTSGLLSGLGGERAASISANAAEKNTEKQIGWERERATSAHQWEVQDLEKAGLNPILSAGGSGATTGGISPQLPDTSGIKEGWNQAAQHLAASATDSYNSFVTAKQLENDQQRVLNETKETNSNLSLKAEQIRLSMEERLNKAVERGYIKQKTATEIKNRMKLQTDIELAQNQMLLNEQLRGKYATEMNLLEKEIEQIEQELSLYPEKKQRIKLENDLTEKENQLYYIKEVTNEIARIGSVGLGIYGAYQANNALSAYKAGQNRTMIRNHYDRRGRMIGTTEQYYK